MHGWRKRLTAPSEPIKPEIASPSGVDSTFAIKLSRGSRETNVESQTPLETHNLLVVL